MTTILFVFGVVFDFVVSEATSPSSAECRKLLEDNYLDLENKSCDIICSDLIDFKRKTFKLENLGASQEGMEVMECFLAEARNKGCDCDPTSG